MTVDEILATGRYTDRRGRVWEYSDNPGLNEWFADIPGDPLERGWWCSPKEMRLLIERDQHRGVCPGMNECREHPAPHVLVDTDESGKFLVFEPNRLFVTWFMDSLPAAMDAARTLAVGE